MTKAEQIFTALRDFPNKSAKETVVILAKQGLHVNVQSVYQVKAKYKNELKGKPLLVGQYLPPMAITAVPQNGTKVTDLLKKIKNVVQEVGGIEELKQVLEYIKL